MNGTNELLRAILKIDEEERARTQATEEYRQKAQADKAAKAKQMEEQAMEDMRHDVDEFAQAEKARAEGELAAQAKRKQQILDQLDQQLQKNKELIRAMFQTYFEKGGCHLMVTVVDKGELEDAMIHPEAHRDLIVRVAGYSAVFVDLDRSVQEELLSRSLHGEEDM